MAGALRAVLCLLLLASVSGFLPSSAPCTLKRGAAPSPKRPERRARGSAAALSMGGAGPGEAQLPRRDALAGMILRTYLASSLVANSKPSLALASDEAAAKVTAKVYMDISVQGVNAASTGSEGRSSNLSKQAARSGRIVLGLFGDEAPGTVAMYKSLFAGALDCPCKDVEIDGVTARDQLQKKQTVKKCKASQGQPVNLEDSSVWKIVKDQEVSFGRLKGKFLLREAPTNQDQAKLSHNRPGLVSTTKGGGDFEFCITPGAAPVLDATNIVFGQVLEGMDLVQILNETPVKQYAGGLGAESKAKACFYGGKDAFCGVNKPLQRIIITKAGLVDG